MRWYNKECWSSFRCCTRREELWYQENWKVLLPISMAGNIGNTGKKAKKKQVVLQFMSEYNNYCMWKTSHMSASELQKI